MPIKSNGYFNDPAFAQAAQNLTSLFEPPSGTDAYGWAKAGAEKADAQRLADFYAYQTGPEYDRATADRMGVGAGVYTPNQSFYSVDQGNITSRQNNAATNATSLRNNQLSELGNLFDPVAKDALRPAMPAEIATQFGAPGALPEVQGNKSPMSETELKALILGGLPENEQRAAALGSTPVQEIVGANGPEITWQADSIGKVPYDKPTGGLDIQFGDDGKPISITQGVSGKITEAQGKNIYAGTMATAPTLDLLRAYDSGALPTGTDYQLNNARGALPDALAPVIVPNISDPGQIFYQNLSTALPFQLMSQSGQAVTEQEYQRKLRELVPVPGESKDVTLAKRRQVETYLEAVSRVAGPGGGHISQALDEYRAAAGAPAAPPPPAGTPAPAAADPYPEGTVISNGQTQMVRRGGKWEPM